MTTDGTQLLRSLGSGIRHGVDSVSALGPTRSGLDPSESFASLMQSVQAGTFSSGAPVGVASNSGIELSSRQLQRLAEAADRATASGANRAVVLIDGMALKLDVNQRSSASRPRPARLTLQAPRLEMPPQTRAFLSSDRFRARGG
jgi:hypothetical protein